MHHLLRRPSAPAVAALAALLIAALVTVGLAPAPASATSGPATTYKFHLDQRDQTALRASRKAARMRARAAKARDHVDIETRRIMAIEDLLADAQGDEQRLREALEARLVEQYKGGASSQGFSYLLASDGLTDVVGRASLLHDLNDRDSALAAAHDISLSRLEDLRAALAELRDMHGEQAAALEDHALDLDTQLVAARSDNIDDGSDVGKNAGEDGTWFVVPGDMAMTSFLPYAGTGGAWNGGTLTPIRQATPAQITATLADPRLDIYPGGRSDIALGRVDGRVLDAFRVLADQFGSVAVTSLVSGHGVYTSSGNISEHAYGCAADIGSLSGIRIEPSTQGHGSITERGVLLLAGLTGDLAPHQVISLNSYGGPTLAMADHYDHIHLGYSC